MSAMEQPESADALQSAHEQYLSHALDCAHEALRAAMWATRAVCTPGVAARYEALLAMFEQLAEATCVPSPRDLMLALLEHDRIGQALQNRLGIRQIASVAGTEGRD